MNQPVDSHIKCFEPFFLLRIIIKKMSSATIWLGTLQIKLMLVVAQLIAINWINENVVAQG